MSQRGPNLYSSDLGESIRKEFKVLYSFGYSIEDIFEGFKLYYGRSFKFKEEWNLFWLIMARIQVDHGNILDEVKEEALKVITSGQDIKQWEEYIEIEKYKTSNADFTNELISKYFETKQINNLTDSIEDTIKMFANFEEQAKEATLKKNVPDKVLEYYDKEDSWAKIDVFGQDGKKYLKLRKKELNKLFDDISDFKPYVKRVSKPFHFSPGWKVGDVIAFKIKEEFDDDIISKDYYGYYMLFRVTGIEKKPLSRILPDLAYEEVMYIAQYDFIGMDIPKIDEIQNFDYITRKTPRTVYNTNALIPIISKENSIMYYWLSFYNGVRQFKKFDYTIVASIDDCSDVTHDKVVMTKVWNIVFINHLQDIFYKNISEKSKIIN